MTLRNALATILTAGAATCMAAGNNVPLVYNRAPLAPNRLAQLPLGQIKPKGWLELQMNTLRNGLTGHLDEAYGLVCGDNNAWLGGEGDAWERGPYWIDGALPMAYIMEDEALLAKVNKWVEAILASQKSNGSFGPDTDRSNVPGMQRDNAADWWPRMVALKILQQHYMATGDERVPEFMKKYFRYQLEKLPTTPLGNWTFWATERGGDNQLIALWLYDLTGEEWLLDLVKILQKQTADWTGRFTTDNHLYRQNSLHCVNLGQGFKEPVVRWQLTGNLNHKEAPKKALERIRHTFGFPIGLWAGDELVHFGNPTRGSELCTAVEMMYSLEEMTRITGDPAYADLLERIAYNALPTQVSPDGYARQYYQQVNQVQVVRAPHEFSTQHGDTDNVYGLLTGYPCCTTNMHQGWPKFTQNLWMANSDGGLTAVAYAPNTVETTLPSGTLVHIDEETSYPFEETISFKITLPKAKSATFPLELRLPDWNAGYTVEVNSKKVLSCETHTEASFVTVDNKWKSGDVVTLCLKADIKTSNWFDEATVIERGPLVYALQMDEKWTRHECTGADAQKYGPYYYEVTSDTPWNVALIAADIKPENIAEAFRFEAAESENPWQQSPLKLKGRGRLLPMWQLSSNSAATPAFNSQISRPGEVGDNVEITLVPYGCTHLRITEFPVRQ